MIIDPLVSAAGGGDPADHDDLVHGQKIDVLVCGVVRDHEQEFLQLARADGRGYFFLDATASGLKSYSKNCLTPGARMVGQVVAQENNLLTITLLPALRSLDCHPSIMSLLRERKREVQKQYGEYKISEVANHQIEISCVDEVAADNVAESLRALGELPRILATLPERTAGMVIGAEKANRIRLEEQANVHWVWVDGNTVGVIGATAKAVQQTIKDIRNTVGSPSTGRLHVPSGKTGRLIGTKGATIRRLTDLTGCNANRVGNSEEWIIVGPTKSSVNTFIQLAKTEVPSAVGRLVSSSQLEIVEDTTKPMAFLFVWIAIGFLVFFIFVAAFFFF